MQFGEQIKLLRKQMRFSQAEMAKKLGISQSYLSLIESGKKVGKTERLLDFFITSMNAGPQWPAVRPDWMPRPGNPFPNAFRFMDTGGLYFFEIEESGMYPVFERGDLVLIDRNEIEVRSGQIYLFEIDGKQEVKLALRTNDSGMKLTDLVQRCGKNDVLLDDSVKCLGRVIYTMRKM